VEPGCPAGLTVLLTDWASTQVALADLEGRTRSESLVSTASTETSGLAFALSGDVVLSGTPTRPGSVVLIDRFGTNVLSWVDTASGQVRGQLPVGTGFESNPQDYLEVDDQRAFVSRWGQNGDSGREAFDRGGDLLVVDFSERVILGSIEMPMQGDLPPRPGGLLRLGTEVIVSLDPIALDFETTGTAVLVGVSVDEEEVVWEATLDGVKSCGRPELSPNGQLLALGCSGELDPAGNVATVDESGLLLFDAQRSPPREVARFSADEIAGQPLQGDVQFASERVVMLKTQTPLDGDVRNRWLAFDLDSEEPREILQAGAGASERGDGLVFGSMVCAPGCSEICLLADADQGVLRRVSVEGGAIELLDPLRVEDRVGLPPRGLLGRR
jgi:hypothetical protein